MKGLEEDFKVGDRVVVKDDAGIWSGEIVGISNEGIYYEVKSHLGTIQSVWYKNIIRKVK